MNRQDNLIESMIEESDSMFLKLLDDYPILDDDDHRQQTIMVTFLANCISRLHILGWSERDLCNEVFIWCEKARDRMNPND